MNTAGKLIGQGNTAEVYQWGTGSILKLYREGLPDSLCEDEFRKTQIACTIVPVPVPDKLVTVDGRCCAVYQRVDGHTMLKAMMYKPWRYASYSRQLAESHIALHKPVTGELPSVKDTLRAGMEATEQLSETEKMSINRYIDTLPDGNMLCHFDYHPGNIIMSAQENYIIDWMTACQGDSMADVARTSIILKFSQIPFVPRLVNRIMSKFQKKIHRQYLKKYLSETQKSYQDVELWELPVAAARLREWIPGKEKDDLLAFIRARLKTIE